MKRLELTSATTDPRIYGTRHSERFSIRATQGETARYETQGLDADATRKLVALWTAWLFTDESLGDATLRSLGIRDEP
jgi:hypothetical protein